MTPAMVAVDLGAESCRVSLLRWSESGPRITLVHRIPNGPVAHGDQLRWDLQAIWAGVEEGLRRCAAIAIEGIASIGVDGWATDYVRLNENGRALSDPFCYRDPRTIAAEQAVHERIDVRRLYALTGLQRLRFNTVYQLYADQMSRHPCCCALDQPAGISALSPGWTAGGRVHQCNPYRAGERGDGDVVSRGFRSRWT